MDFVYNIDVTDNGDFDGLFARSDSSLPDDDGMMDSLLGLSQVDDISTGLSGTDVNYVSIKRTAQFARNALSSATKTRNIPLMIDAYISG